MLISTLSKQDPSWEPAWALVYWTERVVQVYPQVYKDTASLLAVTHEHGKNMKGQERSRYHFNTVFRGETINETDTAVRLLKWGDSGNLHSVPAAPIVCWVAGKN